MKGQRKKMKIEDYTKYYIQGSDHYLIPKDVFMELFNEMINWKEEIKELKDNWNKLREYIKETKLKEFEKDYGKRYGKTFTQAEIVVCNMILDKILELEKGGK